MRKLHNRLKTLIVHNSDAELLQKHSGRMENKKKTTFSRRRVIKKQKCLIDFFCNYFFPIQQMEVTSKKKVIKINKN